MENQKKIKVLFLSTWYPNRYDAMAGLFVRKHAEAVSQYCDVTVLYIHGDKHINTFETSRSKHNKIHEVIIYYPSKDVFFKYINYFAAYLKGFKKIKKSGFFPDIIHANILTRTAFMAFCYKVFTNTPYVISEHWSRYLPRRNGYHGILRKMFTHLVVKNASAILPVSKVLQQAMISNGLKHPFYHIIYNVVDDFFYQEHNIPTPHNVIRKFLHISCFDEQAKNVKGLLRATKALYESRDDFELFIIGTGVDYDDVFKYYTTLKFPENKIHFLGEKSPVEVAEWFAKSDCFVFFSNYETAGVVIAESLAAGKPVISTRVGIAEEFIDDESGILIDTADESALTASMMQIVDNTEVFEPNIIKAKSDVFRFERIGKEITDVYNRTLLKSNFTGCI